MMGRKYKKNEQSKANFNTDKKFSKQKKIEIRLLTDQLLEKCTQMPSVAEDWENYMSVHTLLTQLQDVQNGFQLVRPPREEAFPEFCKWMRENGVSIDKTEITKFPGMGYGLQSTMDMKKGELYLSVPHRMMMTTQAANTSGLGELMREDCMLKAMPNVCLALFLLDEAHRKDSHWKPYIDTLPPSYTTVLYYTPDQMQLLRTSPVFSEALSLCRSIARQYAYLYNLFQRSPLASKVSMRDSFTYAGYRWAVSSVMTRQNPVPSPDGSAMGFGLIPLLDMCNHTPGEITSVFDMASECSEGHCMTDVQGGEQVFMSYGSRPSREFFLHNGFVAPHTEHDSTIIKLGVSKNDPLHSAKTEILSLVGLHNTSSYKLLGWGSDIDPELLTFLRVFVAGKECLEKLKGDEGLRALLSSQDPCHACDDAAVLTFLVTRVTLLLKAYPDDNQLVQDAAGDGPLATPHISELLGSERRVMEYALRVLPQKWAPRDVSPEL